MSCDALLSFSTVYGVLGFVSFKDLPLAHATVTADAKEQVAQESRAPRFTVLGRPKPAEENVPKELTEDKVRRSIYMGWGYISQNWSISNTLPSLGQFAWVAYFSSRSAYHDGEHSTRTTENGFLPSLMSNLLTGDPMHDMAGGYMGPLLHLEKSDSGHCTEPSFSILVVATAKGTDEAQQLVEVNKEHAIQQLTAEEGALRYTIIPSGGDAPNADEVTVRWVETWRNIEDYKLHKNTEHLARNGPRMGALASCIHILEFDESVNYV